MLKKLLTSFLGVFRDDSATVLFPGFGVQPENYVVKFPTQHVINVYFMAHPSGWVIVKYTSPPPCNLSHGQGRRPEPHTADLLRRQ